MAESRTHFCSFRVIFPINIEYISGIQTLMAGVRDQLTTSTALLQSVVNA